MPAPDLGPGRGHAKVALYYSRPVLTSEASTAPEPARIPRAARGSTHPVTPAPGRAIRALPMTFSGKGSHRRQAFSKRPTGLLLPGSELDEHSMPAALVLKLTSNGRANLCQAKSGPFTKILWNKEHIFSSDAFAAAIGGVNVPIGPTQVVPPRESQCPGRAIDCPRRSFEFEKAACRRLIEGYVQTHDPKLGTVLLVPETGPQAQSPERARPVARIPDAPLPFRFLFESRLNGPTGAARQDGCRCLRRKNHTLTSPGWRRGFDPQTQKPTAGAEIAIGRIVERVLLEDPAARLCSHAAQPAQNRRNIRDAKLDFDLTVGPATRGFDAHHSSISRRGAHLRNEESCQIPARASIIASLPPPKRK